MNITVQRQPADKPGPDIVSSLLIDNQSGVERGTAEINETAEDRKLINGNGPKNELMMPGSIVAVVEEEERTNGYLTMYTRSYNLSNREYAITSAVSIETVLED